MLEHLFGSKTRVKLLRLFLGNPGASFYVREITRKVGAQLHAVRRELENLEALGIIRSAEVPAGDASGLRAKMRKYHCLDGDFSLLAELRSLVLKSQFLVEQEFKRRVKQLGTIRYFALLGVFLNEPDGPVDVVIVGTLHRQRLARLMAQFEREIGRSLNYTVMSVRDFEYRRGVGDRFLYGILEGRKITVIDEITPAAQAAREGITAPV